MDSKGTQWNPMQNGRVEGTPEQWQRVADAVTARRVELGLSRPSAVTRAQHGVSESTWGQLERNQGTSYQLTSLGAICRALDWTTNSIILLLRGEEPVELSDDEKRQDSIGRLRNREDAGRETVREIQSLLADQQEIRRAVESLRSSVESLLARVEWLEGRSRQ